MTSVTLKKGFAQFRSRGIFGGIRRGWTEIRNFFAARSELPRRRTFDNIDALLDYGFNTCGGMIRPLQCRYEIRRLLEMVQALKPRRIMEIGTANVGTLFLWTRVAAPDATLVSLDLPGGDFGGGYPAWKRKLYESFALPGQSIQLLQADSHHPSSLEQVKKIIGGEPLDFLLIDGDHSAEGVRQDFSMYAPLVRPGGLVAFHDITPHQCDPHTTLRRTWEQLMVEFPGCCEEIMESPDQKGMGIGVIHIGKV